jgi:hypothetical protein
MVPSVGGCVCGWHCSTGSLSCDFSFDRLKVFEQPFQLRNLGVITLPSTLRPLVLTIVPDEAENGGNLYHPVAD